MIHGIGYQTYPCTCEFCGCSFRCPTPKSRTCPSPICQQRRREEWHRRSVERTRTMRMRDEARRFFEETGDLGALMGERDCIVELRLIDAEDAAE